MYDNAARVTDLLIALLGFTTFAAVIYAVHARKEMRRARKHLRDTHRYLRRNTPRAAGYLKENQ